MRRDLGLLGPGTYTVRWTTVSPLDGHTRKGTHTFAIGGRATSEQAIESDPVSSQGWLGLAGRWIALAGLVAWAGHTVLRRRAVRPGSMPDGWTGSAGVGRCWWRSAPSEWWRASPCSRPALAAVPRLLVGSQTGRL
ncbi:MAG: copper resistance protein CopC, partial [Nitriliruptorales bacterium]